MSRPRLILLHGFAGVGKTTIVKKYVNDNPLVLNLEGDVIIELIGQWSTHHKEARRLTFELSISMARTYLRSNHDVVVPYLPSTSKHLQAFEYLAKECRAQFNEVVLDVEREEAIRRLLNRGTWGEEGAEPITEKDMPKIEELYNNMVESLKERSDAVRIPSVEGDPEDTYKRFLKAIGDI